MPEEDQISSRVLAEIAGRLRHATKDIWETINSKEEPQPKPWQFPAHHLDAEAASIGLRGFEYAALQEAAQREMPRNEMLQQAYRQFLMIAKLCCEDALAKARKYERQQAEQKSLREDAYERRKLQWEKRRDGLLTGWEVSRKIVRAKWASVVGDLKTKTNQDAAVGRLSLVEGSMVASLVHRELMRVEDNQVQWANWQAIESMEFGDLRDLLAELDTMPGGEFIKK